MIAERHNPVADDLAGFMALAGNEQHISGPEAGDCGTDRFVAIADLDGAGRGGDDCGADRGGVFAARIVVGDDDAVGLCGRDRPHQRTLAAVAVAAGAQHDH